MRNDECTGVAAMKEPCEKGFFNIYITSLAKKYRPNGARLYVWHRGGSRKRTNGRQ